MGEKQTLVCSNCGGTFEREKGQVKRLKAEGQKFFFCTVSCSREGIKKLKLGWNKEGFTFIHKKSNF